MKALVYTGRNSSELRDVEAPVAARGQSIVDLSFCGICGSDIHAWHGHDERRIPPLVLGHEAVGTALTGPLAGPRCVPARLLLVPAQNWIPGPSSLAAAPSA